MPQLIRARIMRFYIAPDYYRGKCFSNTNIAKLNNVKKEENYHFYNGVCFSNTKYEKIRDVKKEKNYHFYFNGVCFRITYW